MTAENTTKSNGAESSETGPDNLTRTIGIDSIDGIDPALQEALDDGTLTKEDIDTALKMQEYVAAQAQEDAEAESGDEPAETSEEAEGESESGAEQTEAATHDTAENEPEAADTATDDEGTASTAGKTTDEPGAIKRSSASPASIEEEEKATESSEDSKPADKSPAETDSTGSAPADESGFQDTMAVDLNPLAVAFADRIRRSADQFDPEANALDEVIVEIVDRYIIALLSGEATGSEDEQFAVDLAASPAVEQGLESAVEDHGQVDSQTDLVAAGIASVIGEETQVSELSGITVYRRQLQAIQDNDETVFAQTDEIIEAAIGWFVTVEQGESPP